MSSGMFGGGFDEYLSVVSDDVFEETPVDLHTFITHKDYMGMPEPSALQLDFIERLTQIYRLDTVEALWGADEAKRLSDKQAQEVILMIGKGGGKNMSSTLIMARIAYLLLCLKSPAEYYGKPRGDGIHMLNVAVNAKQADKTFFEPLRKRIEQSPWFKGRFDTKAGEINFDKNISAYSGHSEREAWEGYNLILVILDEIAAFRTDAELSGTNDRTNSASAIYDMYKASVTSRFPAYGKLALLSFPRFKGDYITERYEQVVREKETILREHTFKIHEELEDGIEDNELHITWEEDHVVSYSEPGVYAIRRPTWDVNPIMEIDDLKSAFIRNKTDSLGRFACMPQEVENAFFKNVALLERAFPHSEPPMDDRGRFREFFKPDGDKNYYVHVDLGYKHDRAAVAMAHVEKWVNVEYSKNWIQPEPIVVVDLVRWWTPTPDKNVDFGEIKSFIRALRNQKFPLKMVTFDRWNSITTMNELKSMGISTDTLSVAKPHYEEMAVLVADQRLHGYHIPLLMEELKTLRIVPGNKVDHTSSGSNDLGDAVCGAVYNAVTRERMNVSTEIELEFLDEFVPEKPPAPEPDERSRQRDRPPMPPDVSEYLARMDVI